ncbi:hypothetical protein IHV12_21980 [Fictibacillus sp. 7GRE50]|uniref:hypothetical protein n=1 Tax=unclassified Fictibacillus TaxID=2644029 RepID=UPI0018CE8BA4|nr:MULTISPECIES: hypothetical protein [unclassified Fictibacillus]MBH0167581.1 hypothetical protein [Fictibacillus sp. 7GRE50]MBH0176164.1 hypothetical protein [Fictibacillus sp. 23RED33]
MQLWLIIFCNLLAIFLGLIFGIGFYKKKRNEIGDTKGKILGISIFVFVMIFFNGILVYTDFKDEQREKSALSEMEMNYKENGVSNQESYKNLNLAVRTYSINKKKYYEVYVSNFNKKVTFTGKVLITVKDDKEKVGEITTEKITLKPGEKMMIDSYTGPKYYDEYSWKWIGELK